MSMVKDALFNEEARRKDIDHGESHALITERGRQQERSQDKRRGRSKSRGKSTDGRKSSYACYHCGIKGHLKKNCRKLHKKEQLKQKDGDALVTTHGEVAIFSIQEKTYLHVSSQEENEWVVDIAASYHATS